MSMKHAWIVFLVALVVALPVRLYQLLVLMEEDTGFFEWWRDVNNSACDCTFGCTCRYRGNLYGE